jgi:5'-nucleotidase/UDP-sugar diphosphatase
VVVALTHLGYDEPELPGQPQSGSEILARSVPGIDLIVDGHSHTRLDAPVSEHGTVIAQAGEYGRYVGRVDLLFDGERVRMAGGSLLPVNPAGDAAGEPVPEDPAMLALLAPFQEKGEAALQKVIGQAAGDFPADRAVMRSAPTALGSLVCRAVQEKTGADAAVMNSGGIRAGLAAGDISYKDVLTVKPFGNIVCTVDMTGAELAEYLRLTASLPPGSGGFAQYGGVGFTLRGGTVENVTVNGAQLDAGGVYTVATDSYLAAGGDGYPRVDHLQGFVNTGFVDADVLREYIMRHSPLDPAAYSPSGVVRRE